jgi:hypothetical protein
VFPLAHLFQQTEDVLRLATLKALEGTVLFVVLVRERNDVVLDLTQHCRTNIEGDLELVVRSTVIILIAEIGDLQFDLAELGDDIVEAVAKDGILLMLEDLQVELLKEFILSLDQLLLADTEQNGNLRGEPPEFFILDHSRTLRIVLLPQAEAVFELEDVDGVIFDLVIVVVGTGHSGDEEVQHQQDHDDVEAQEIGICHPCTASHGAVMSSIRFIHYVIA